MPLKMFLAGLVAVSTASAAMADATPGQTPLQAEVARDQHALAAQLRQAWRAAGKPDDDSTPPAITAGKVLTPHVTVGHGASSPRVKFTYTTGSAGLSSVQLYFTSATGGQTMDLTYYTQYGTPPPTSGTLVLEQPVSNGGPGNYSSMATSLGNYAAPGTWTMTEIYITDEAGNETYYGPPQIAQIFPTPSFTAINKGQSDTTPPSVTVGRVLTPTVSESAAYPVFGATLTVSDALSGVHSVAVLIAPPGQPDGGYAGPNVVAAPTRSGSVTSYTRITPGNPVGTWTIFGYSVCDVAGNCVYDTKAADMQALFGTTTFTVTQ